MTDNKYNKGMNFSMEWLTRLLIFSRGFPSEEDNQVKRGTISENTTRHPGKDSFIHCKSRLIMKIKIQSFKSASVISP